MKLAGRGRRIVQGLAQLPLYGERTRAEIDEEVREEYWTTLRGLHERSDQRTTG